MQENGQEGSIRGWFKKCDLSVNLTIESSYYITNHVHSTYKTLLTFILQTNPKLRELSIGDRILECLGCIMLKTIHIPKWNFESIFLFYKNSKK